MFLSFRMKNYVEKERESAAKRLAQVPPPPPTATRFNILYAGPNAKALTMESLINFPPQYFSGIQLKSLYSVPTVVPKTATTRKSVIAIIVAFSYKGVLVDLNTYWQNAINFGPNSTPPTVNVYTMPGATANADWAMEECLDVQMVATMNPNATIWVVEAKSDTFPDLMAAIDYATSTLKVDVISISWGMNDNSALTTYAKSFNAANTVFCAASGDCNNVSWPAVLSNCVAVGGTTLIWSPNSSTQPRTEYTWNKAGCGYSNTVSQPAYQSGVAGITHAFRAVPDVSLVANDCTSVYSVYCGNWYGVGGTSVGTPIFASIVSLANQQRFNAGKGPLTTIASSITNNIQNYLYKTILPNATKYAATFNDVKLGTNIGSVEGSATRLAVYNSGTGFDLPTGLGSPNATALCTELSTNIP